MNSKLEKFQRPLVLLGVFFVLLITAATLLELNMEFSGVLFGCAAIALLIYLPLSWFFTKRKNQTALTVWYKKEFWFIAVGLMILCIAGCFESLGSYMVFTIIFGEVLLLMTVFFAINFSAGFPQKYGIDHLKNTLFPKWIFWLFFLGNGLLILLFEDYLSGKELFAIAILGYLMALIVFVISWIFNQIKTVIGLKQAQQQTELMHLQSQVNPHFFFNMLNNLYGWVGKDSKKAQELMLSLSEMMRYSIYDGQKNEVQLAAEIDYLKNYIDLHKMRYHKQIDISFDLDVVTESVEIRPLLFIILVENAFKHGVESLRAGAFVKISLSATEEKLKFVVENNFDNEVNLETGGIGLKNLKRRLELVYPKKHELTLSTEANIYQAQLKINLT